MAHIQRDRNNRNTRPRTRRDRIIRNNEPDIRRFYRNGRYELNEMNLSGINLSGVNLQNAQLQEADLTGADLTGADLTDANLTGVNLTGVNLTGANLTGAHLMHAILRYADLTVADLTGANLSYAVLTDAILTDAILDPQLRDILQQQLQLQQQAEAQYQQQAQGVQIHNFFNRIRLDKLNEIISELPPGWKDQTNIIDYISRQFYVFIDENYENDEKDRLLKILFKLMENISTINYENNIKLKNEETIKLKELIAKSVYYAFKQQEVCIDFTKNYVEIFISDSSEAYQKKNEYSDIFSCAKGVVERIITSLGSAAAVICAAGCPGKPYEEEYTKLIEIFSTTLDKNELLKKWKEEVTPIWDTELKGETDSETKEKREEHFRNFMKEEYSKFFGYSYNEKFAAIHDAELKEDIKTYEYVFSNMDDPEPIFGGKRKNNKMHKLYKTNKSKKRTMKKSHNKRRRKFSMNRK